MERSDRREATSCFHTTRRTADPDLCPDDCPCFTWAVAKSNDSDRYPNIFIEWTTHRNTTRKTASGINPHFAWHLLYYASPGRSASDRIYCTQPESQRREQCVALRLCVPSAHFAWGYPFYWY